MAAIVENDVDRPKFVSDALKKPWIRLISDPNSDLIFLIFRTFVRNVQAHDLGERAEIAFPHLQRAASSAANLDKGDR
jgi:hypothetical protein